jgi:hypothetical protein
MQIRFLKTYREDPGTSRFGDAMTIRIETDGATDLAGMTLWLAQHRGEMVRIDETRRLLLGAPITGARAVIVAAVLQDDDHPGPQIGGVVRALANRADADPVRLVFEGRSPAGLSREEAEGIAAEILETISVLAVEGSQMAEVA